MTARIPALKISGLAILGFLVCGSDAAANECYSYPLTLRSTAPASLSVIVSGSKPCHIYFDSRGGVSRVIIEKRPSRGSATVDGSGTIVYRARPGYAGRDSFVYAMHAFDRRNISHAVRVRVDVDVRP